MKGAAKSFKHGSTSASSKTKQLKEGREVGTECTVHSGGAQLLMSHRLASHVQSFFLKAEDFSLVFLSSSILAYRISPSQPY